MINYYLLLFYLLIFSNIYFNDFRKIGLLTTGIPAKQYNSCFLNNVVFILIIAVSTTVPVCIIHMSLYDLAMSDAATSMRNPNSGDVKPGITIFKI